MRDAALDRPHVNLLGDFVLGAKLGEGGFGTVYRAEQRTLGRPAVVKVIRHSLITNRDAAERFSLEARLASRFDHPYAAHIYAFGIEPDGLMWIAMELVKGIPLDRFLEMQGAIPIERFVPLMERLCDVVQAAHEQQIVHRDIKPSNVMVMSRGGRLVPKLLDFGIAKALPIGGAGATPPSPARQPRLRTEPPDVRASAAELEHTVDASASSPSRASVATDATMDVHAATDATMASASTPAVRGSQPSLVRASAGTDDTAMVASASASAMGASASLTRAGQILGSPPYMAPEQWADAVQVGPASDQYALALLAWEALVGRRAYVATTLDAFRELHDSAPLPPLPEHLPAALHAVLARATAKRPADRYPSLTELGQALREAAFGTTDLPDDAAPLALPPDQRARWSDEAPAPIAESISALATARTPSRIVDRAHGVAAVLARWMGVLALACQSRVGRCVAGTATHALVLAARRHALTDREWLDLAVGLAAPFAERPEAWPVPDLAAYFADTRVETLRALLEQSPTAATLGESSRHDAERCLGLLAVVLQGAGWMLDYELARTTERGLEIWTGLGTERRPVRTTTHPDRGAVVLLDADNVPVVCLSPLVQIAAPIPGQRAEVFLFAGPSHDAQASRAIAYPRGYERDDHETWSWFASQLLDLTDREAVTRDEAQSPYPGLSAFTQEDHASFVGREAEVEELTNRLREQHLVAVVGPSGVGKSSFIAAGVTPALPAGWRAATMRPGATPLAVLRGLVDHADSPYRDAPRRDIALEQSALADALVATARQQLGVLVVVIDQAEELFTMCAVDDDREVFAAVLMEAAATDHVRVIVSLRDDFLVRVDQLRAWRGQLARGVQVLRMPDPSTLQRTIAVPAQRCGYDFDDAALPAEIASEVAGQPGALPLVAFVAAELWQRRDRHFKQLTRAAYQEIGGVSGALVQHADGLVDRMPAPERRLVRLAFRRLLTTEGTRALVGRAELAAALGVDGERVIERLITSRLVVSRDDDAGERVEVIHESLVTTWPRLAAWRHEDAATTKFQERLAAAARHWRERDRPGSLLWRGPELVELARLERDASWSALEREFATQSLVIGRRTRRRRIATVAAAFGVLLAGTAVLVLANRQVTAQRRGAVERLSAGFEERGRLAVAEGDGPGALLYLAESRRLGRAGATNDVLVSRSLAALEAQVQIVGHSDSPILRAQFEGEHVLSVGADGAIQRWSDDGHVVPIAKGARDARETQGTVVVLDEMGRVAGYATNGGSRWAIAPIEGLVRLVGSSQVPMVVTLGETTKFISTLDGATLGNARVTSSAAAFDSSGARLAIGGRSGDVSIYDVATRVLLTTCPGHSKNVSVAEFTLDGTLLVTGSADRHVRVCEVATGTSKHHFLGHLNSITTLALSEDGRHLATGSRDGGVFVWDMTTGAAQSSFSIGSSVKSVVFSPDERQLATCGRDGAVRIWDRGAGSQVGSLQGHSGNVTQVHWDPTRLLTTSMDGSIRRWDVGRAIHTTVTSHGPPIVANDMHGALTLFATGKRAVLWDSRTSMTVREFSHAANVTDLALAADARTSVTITADREATMWSLADGQRRQLASPDAVLVEALRDGSYLTSHDDGHLRWWDSEGRRTAEIQVGFQAALAISPDGRWAAAVPDTLAHGEVAFVDLQSRAIVKRIPSQPTHRIAFGSDRVALSRGSEIEVFQLGTWQSLGVLRGHEIFVSGLWFLPDGRLVSSGDDARLIVWSKAGTLLRTLATSGDIVQDFAVSPSGDLLAAIGYEGTLRIFDAASMHRVLTLPGHRAFSAFLRFTEDGSAIVTTGNDGRAIRWNVQRAERTPADLAEIVRCRVPLRLDGDVAVPRKLDLDDPTCRR